MNYRYTKIPNNKNNSSVDHVTQVPVNDHLTYLNVNYELKISFKRSVRVEQKVVRSVDIARHQCWLWITVTN